MLAWQLEAWKKIAEYQTLQKKSEQHDQIKFLSNGDV